MAAFLSKRNTAILGFASVLLLLLSLMVFGNLNTEFRFLEDYISMLGAQGQPNALWFNIFGFVLVGLLLFGFGLGYGLILKDRLLAVFLSLFGLGFAFAAIPTDFQPERDAASKAHIVAICLGLAFWMFGLARIGANKNLSSKVRQGANIVSGMLALAIVGAATDLYSMPFAHRMVFAIVFGWTLLTAIGLMRIRDEY